MANEGHAIDVPTCHSVLAAASDTRTAQELLKRMKLWSLTPDMTTYTLAVRACRGPHALSTADGLLQEAKAAGLEPDAVMFSAMLRACKLSRDADRALALFRDMEAAPRCAEAAADVRSWNRLLAALTAALRPDAVLETWGEMAQRGVAPDEISYAYALAARAARGERD
ncbi:hypothetical protein JKP88DRAFT_169351, partial [Tribonema minus]